MFEALGKHSCPAIAVEGNILLKTLEVLHAWLSILPVIHSFDIDFIMYKSHWCFSPY